MTDALYNAEQMRRLDQAAIAAGLPGWLLMQRAGAAAFARLEDWLAAGTIGGRRLLVCCGGGNNGGDGYVVARLAHLAGWSVRVAALVEPARLRGDAARAAGEWLASGGTVDCPPRPAVDGCDAIVDAVFGTGLSRPVEGRARDWIEALAAAAAPVLAVDLPSGLCADRGTVLGAAVPARETVTFIGHKLGLYTGAGPAYAGRVSLADLGVPPAVYDEVEPCARRIGEADLHAALPPRRRDAHKGDFGHVLVVGGAPGMPGAVLMAGRAALRCGAGRATLASHPVHAALLPLAQNELMSLAAGDAAALAGALQRCDVVAVGPGLGQGEWGRSLLEAVLDAPGPRVVDADGLNLLAAAPRPRGDWILSPHPGEAARLLGRSTAEVQADRPAAARAIAERYRAWVVLKGAGTLVASPAGGLWLCDRGHQGMASAGMGDVLTGLLAGLWAQCRDPGLAARAAVWLHAAAAEAAGGRGILATDLLPQIQRLVQ